MRALVAVLVATLGIALLSSRQACAQEPEPMPTLRLSTRVVAVSAVVRGRDGRPMGGLGRDDFELRQDGHVEPIRYFSQGSELPLTVALMVDTSQSQRAFIGDETLAADVFFDAMLGRGRANPQDRATLVQFDSNVLDLAPMTASPNALHLALMRLSQPHAGRANAGTLLYDGIAETATKLLAGQSGRKAMILLTDGDDHGSSLTLEAALEQAQRADVSIYAIDYTDVAFASGMRRQRPESGGIAGRMVLERITAATGGRVFTVAPALGLREIFAQIGQDLRLQYELGYTPPADTKPNSLHRIELHALDKQLTVQARKAFYSQP